MNKITMINFSKSLIQEDSIRGKNKELYFYSTQKGSFISYLTSKFPNVSVDLIGINHNLKFNIQNYKKFRAIKLPALNNVAISVILFNITSFFYLLKHRTHLIYAYTDAKLYPYIGTLLYAKLARIPFFIDFRNPPRSYFYKTNPDAPGPLYKNMLLKIIDKLCMEPLDALFMINSSVIVHISDKSKDLLKSNPKLYQKSIVVSSCPQNIFLVHKREMHNKRRDSKNNKLIFSYWGIIHKKRKLDVLIEGFTKAKKSNKEFSGNLYIIGNGDDLDRLEKLVKEHNIENIVFKGYLKQEELYSFLERVSVAVIPIPPSELFQYSSPLKLAEAVTMELPMIASNIEPNQIVKEHNLGILCEHGVDSYAQAFLKFWSFSDSELNKFRENCKKVKYLYIPKNAFKEVESAIASILKNER